MAAMANPSKKATPYVIAFKDGVQAVLPVVEFLTPAIMGLVAAYTALQIINKVNAQIAATKAAFELMATTTAKITALTNAKTVAELANNGVQTKYLAANLASMSALTAKKHRDRIVNRKPDPEHRCHSLTGESGRGTIRSLKFITRPDRLGRTRDWRVGHCRSGVG